MIIVPEISHAMAPGGNVGAEPMAKAAGPGYSGGVFMVSAGFRGGRVTLRILKQSACNLAPVSSFVPSEEPRGVDVRYPGGQR